MENLEMNADAVERRLTLEHRTLALALQVLVVAVLLMNMFFGTGIFVAVMIAMMVFVTANAVEMFRTRSKQAPIEPVWDF